MTLEHIFGLVAIDPVEAQKQALVSQLSTEVLELVETEHVQVDRIVRRFGAVADFEADTILTLFALHWVIAKIKLRLITLCPWVPVEETNLACMEIAHDLVGGAGIPGQPEGQPDVQTGP